MNLVQLKYFQAVCLYHTVSDAAEFLHISQPSLSYSIKELEKEFGVPLFRRQHRGMVLTPEGETFLKLSSDLLSRAEQIENTMKDMGNERKILRLGVPPMIGSLILPNIYREFPAIHPEIQLDITEGGRSELLPKLSEDYLDMVFLPHTRPFSQEYAQERMARFEIVCCVSRNNPLSKKQSVTPDDLKNVPLVLFKNSFFQTGEIKKWFAAEHVTPDILLQTEQLSTVQSLITSNMAAGFLFRQLIESVPGFVPIPAEKPIFVDVSLVWKKNGYFLSCMKKFREYIKKHPEYIPHS